MGISIAVVPAATTKGALEALKFNGKKHARATYAGTTQRRLCIRFPKQSERWTCGAESNPIYRIVPMDVSAEKPGNVADGSVIRCSVGVAPGSLHPQRRLAVMLLGPGAVAVSGKLFVPLPA
jgi:hypothetical protein